MDPAGAAALRAAHAARAAASNPATPAAALPAASLGPRPWLWAAAARTLLAVRGGDAAGEGTPG